MVFKLIKPYLKGSILHGHRKYYSKFPTIIKIGNITLKFHLYSSISYFFCIKSIVIVDDCEKNLKNKIKW